MPAMNAMGATLLLGATVALKRYSALAAGSSHKCRTYVAHVQGAPAAEELQQGSSLEKEEAQLRGLALELEALAAQLNQVTVGTVLCGFTCMAVQPQTRKRCCAPRGRSPTVLAAFQLCRTCC